MNKMIGNSQEASEVYNHFSELWKLSDEDLNRVFTEEELKELCLRHKCKVDIWRWNVVDDYRLLFTQSGRYQKWSEQDRLRMLAKAVNKIKPTIHKEEEIRKTREEAWKLQLKENILSLNYWKRRRLNATQTILTESDDVDPEIRLQCEVNTESLNSPEFLTASQRQELENKTATYNPNEQDKLQIEVSKTSGNVEKQNKKLAISESRPKTPLIPAKLTALLECNIIEGDFEEDYLTDKDSEDSVDTVMLNEKHEVMSPDILQSNEVAPEINNIYDVSTMSMTIDSQISTQSQDLKGLQSQDVIPPNYDYFKNTLPLTSTQSQSQEMEGKVVL